MSLITFTTPFTGGPTFYTGQPGSSDLVPDIFPVAIAGRPYMLDMASGKYTRVFEARLRESADDSDVPGEAAINPQGLWRRGQSSWHFGFGQQYGDLPSSNVERFEASLNVDVWEPGQLSLLPATKVAASTTGTNLFLAVVGDELWYSDDDDIKYTTDPFAASPSWTTISGSAEIRSMVSIGKKVFVTVAGTTDGYGLIEVPSSTHAWPASSEAYGLEFGVLGYAKGKLLVAANATGEFWVDPSGTKNAGSGHFTHPDADFRWVGFAAGQNAIYAAGYSGQRSLIYKMTIKADGNLDVPVVAGELPVGEVVYSINSYLGFILIGTNEGLRYATADADANLVIGQTIRGPKPVRCADGYQEYVWCGVSDYTPDFTGLGRIDLSRLVGPNVPAAAPDLMHEDQGDVLSVVTFDSKRVFTVSGVGVIVEDADNLAETGYVDTGTWRWGIPDKKFLAFVDLEYEQLNGTIDVEYAFDGGAWEALGTAYSQGGTFTTFTGPDGAFREADFRVTLNRDSVTPSEGPVLARWQARAVPAPTRSELFQIPILLHERIFRYNREYWVDVDGELEFLRNLIYNPRIVTFQEGLRTYKVICESVEWTPVDTPNDSYVFDGTATVTLRSLVE